MGPGAAVQAYIDGFGAFATGSSYSVVNGVKYLGFQIDKHNGFAKVEPFTGHRNRLNVLGWGLESEPFVPTMATLSEGSGAVSEPGTIGMFTLGTLSLVM